MDKTKKELEEELNELKKELDKFKDYEKKSVKRKIWFLKKGAGFFLGSSLKNSLRKTINEISEKGRVHKETMADLITNIIKRFTRVGLFTVFVALIPLIILFYQTWLLNNQNEKLDIQNELIVSQNKRITVQANLEDSNRRNNLLILMDNLLNKINEDLKDTTLLGGISRSTFVRIVALNQGFQPYRVLDVFNGQNNKDTLVLTKLISPERGQLLLSISNIGIENDLLTLLFARTRFDYAFLNNSVLDTTYLGNVQLKYANLDSASLTGSNMVLADLENASLVRSRLHYTDLSNSNLYEADLRRAWVLGTKLEDADLRKVKLDSAIFRPSSLHGAKVDREDWFSYLYDTLKLKKFDDISMNYKVVKDSIEDYYRVLKISDN